MVSCKECATLNSLDSAFCKSCGKPLAQEAALDAREKLGKQIDQGFELFHHGRTDEAALVIESSLLADPTNLRALSLKALILERRGLLLEALDCYEAIVKRDPNAALERMKLQSLRGLLDAKAFSAPQVNRRMALIVAACATVFVISIGAIAAVLATGGSGQSVASLVTDKPSYSASTFGNAAVATPPKKPETAPANEGAPAETNPEAAGTSPLSGNVSGNALLPKPTNDPTAETSPEIRPINPLNGAEIRQIPTPNTTLPSPTNNNVTAPRTDPDPAAVSKENKPAEPPPIVDIQISGGQPDSSDNRLDQNGVEALVRTARSQYQVGSYQAAAATYERALRAGADPSLINQRIGQCYERLGRTSDAKEAYSRAITALETAIAGGRGNKERLLAALDSSKQALKNLQGG